MELKSLILKKVTSFLLFHPHSSPASPHEMASFAWLKINLIECLTSTYSNHILKKLLYLCCLYRNQGDIIEEGEDCTFFSASFASFTECPNINSCERD